MAIDINAGAPQQLPDQHDYDELSMILYSLDPFGTVKTLQGLFAPFNVHAFLTPTPGIASIAFADAADIEPVIHVEPTPPGPDVLC